MDDTGGGILILRGCEVTDFRSRDAEVEQVLGRVVGHIDGEIRRIATTVATGAGAERAGSGLVTQPVALGQSALDELRDATGRDALAYGYLIVRALLKPPLLATGFGDEAVRRMIGGCGLARIPAGSPAVDGTLVREDRRAFWVRRVREDLTCRWQLIEVPSAFDVMRSGDARNALTSDRELEDALVAWGIVPPPKPAG